MKSSIKSILSNTEINHSVTINGWVRTKRENKNVAFLSVNDGSTVKNMQIVVDKNIFEQELIKTISTGVSVMIIGNVVASQGAGQDREIQATQLKIYGTVEDNYPLQKKEHTLEFLREIAHLRPRTNTFGAIFRLRHAVSYAIHTYFNQNGFFYFHTPIITASDCEGAGSQFRITTFDLSNVPKKENNDVDFENDFFGKETHLTVSGQLEGELGAMGLGAIYTFGPTFRAEKSNTTRHLSEFWMIEPEVAFYDIQDNMDLAEGFLKFILKYVLENNLDDIEYLHEFHKKDLNKKNSDDEFDLIEKLKFVINNNFVRVTYTEGVEILKSSKHNVNKKFQYPVKWGIDLQSEHERYLVEKHFGKPVILTDYPKDIKAFYMKQNDDGKTVRAMDILFPGIGEIIGGSQREENYEKLVHRLREMMISEDSLYWYLDTRRFGSVPHSGFGLGFERLMLFITGMTNIRDVIPFPRSPLNAEF